MRIGPYEVLANLGQGGAGVVVKARAPDGSIVAIKVLVRRSQSSLARFDRERRLLEELGQDAGFVPLLGAGEDPQHGPYVVMPFLGGGTLRDRLRRGPLDLDDALELGRALASAMARAHERGIVHRDLKPDNVLFTEDGAPLIADLGIAKHFQDDSGGAIAGNSLSRTGELKGTPGYMPREQMQDAKNVGAPADVFALGAMLYECVVGEPPFAGTSLVEVLHRVDDGSIVPMAARRPDTPAWLDAVVARALAREATERHPHAGALHAALVRPDGGALGKKRAIVASALVALLIAVAAIFASPRAPTTPPPANITEVAPEAPPKDPKPGTHATNQKKPARDALVDPTEQRALSLELEKKDDARAALDAWYRLLDTAPATTAMRCEAMDHVRRLVARVPANKDLERATLVWRAKAVIFTRTKHAWTDDFGGSHDLDLVMSAKTKREVRASALAWRQLVFDLTRGLVRIDVDFEEVDVPVTRWSGKIVFTIGAHELPYDFVQLQRQGYDSAVAYVDLGNKPEMIPCKTPRIALKTDNDLGLAISKYLFFSGTLEASTGRSELNMWLRQVDGVLRQVQGWPNHFFPYEETEDGQEEAWAECHPKQEGSMLEQLSFFRHFLQEHATPTMLRSLSTREQVPNPWNAGCVHAFKVAGPYAWAPGRGKSDGRGLEVDTPLDPDALPREETTLVPVPRRVVRFDQVFPEAKGTQLVVAQTWVRVPRAQTVLVRLGSDDGVRVHVNGRPIFQVVAARSTDPDDNEWPIELEAGWNQVVLKVENLMGAWGTALEVVGVDGLPVEGIEIAPERP